MGRLAPFSAVVACSVWSCAAWTCHVPLRLRANSSPCSARLRKRLIGPRGATPPDGSDEKEGKSFDAAKLLEQASEKAKEGIETAVRSTTGDASYKFGDISKKVLDEVVRTEESAVRKLTGDETYKFGDYSKQLMALDVNGDGRVDFQDAQLAATRAASTAMAELVKAEETAVRKITGDETYQFGDIAKKVIDEGEKALGKDWFDMTPTALWKKLFEGMSVEQRAQAVFAMLQLSSVALLCYQFVANVITALIVVASWAHVTTDISPLASTQVWSAFIVRVQTIRLATDPIAVPVKAALTLLSVANYRLFVRSLQKTLPLRSKPNLNRALALLAAFVLHTVSLAGLTWTSVWGITRLRGAAMFPS